MVNEATDLETNSLETDDCSPGDHSQLDDEDEKPWPATFERSISLLSSPIISAPQAEHFTRSPKPGGTPLTGRRAERGYLTPEKSSLLAPNKRGDDFDKGVQKTHSLDFKSQYQAISKPVKPLKDTQKEVEKKALEAKAYRQKLLQQKQGDVQLSPGFNKEKKPKKKHGEEVSMEAKATFSQCVFNMANILMGVGLLGLPFALKSAGWLGGIAIMIIMGLITWRTSALIGREMNGDPRPASFFDDSPFKTPLPPGSSADARMRPPLRSFPDIARASFGEPGCVALSIVLYFELFSCLCIFIISIGDHLHTLFPAWSTSTHMILMAASTVIPTVVLRTPRLLSYLSAVGTISTIAVVLVVISAAVLEGDISDHVVHMETKRRLMEQSADTLEQTHHAWSMSGVPLTLGLVAYCFSGHAIVPSIYSSMQRPQDFEKMIDLTFLIVGAACLAVSLSGYYMFGDAVLDQVTLSLEQNSSAVLIMKVLTWMIIMTSFSKYILTMYPLALGMEEIVAPWLSGDLAMQLASSLVKLFLTGLALLVALYVPSFGFVCALVGLICTMAVSVIFPAAAHLKLFDNRLGCFEKLVDWIFVFVGLSVAIVGTIATVA